MRTILAVITASLNIRWYVIRNNHLFLSLMADGGIYEFQPIEGRQP